MPALFRRNSNNDTKFVDPTASDFQAPAGTMPAGAPVSPLSSTTVPVAGTDNNALPPVADSGTPPNVDPSTLQPISGYPGQFTDGRGKGGDAGNGNSSGTYEVYDQSGKWLGQNTAVTTNGSTTIYGYSTNTPPPTALPGAGGPDTNAPTGQPNVDPSKMHPIAGVDGQYTDGGAQGGHDPTTGNAAAEYNVYDATGKYLGQNASVTINGATTNYGYSYGTPIPQDVQLGTIPGASVFNPAAAGGPEGGAINNGGNMGIDPNVQRFEMTNSKSNDMMATSADVAAQMGTPAPAPGATSPEPMPSPGSAGHEISTSSGALTSNGPPDALNRFLTNHAPVTAVPAPSSGIDNLSLNPTPGPTGDVHTAAASSTPIPIPVKTDVEPIVTPQITMPASTPETSPPPGLGAIAPDSAATRPTAGHNIAE